MKNSFVHGSAKYTQVFSIAACSQKRLKLTQKHVDILCPFGSGRPFSRLRRRSDGFAFFDMIRRFI